MWIPKAISENSGIEQPFTAQVVFADGESVNLAGAQGSGKAIQFLPYGIESVPPNGSRAVAVPTGRTLCVCGTQTEGKLELEPGEIGLFSSGGASIVLKNDGSVVINGRTF